LRRDAVLGVVFDLLLAPPLGLGHRALHRAGDLVGVEDAPGLRVARGAADGLDQRGLASAGNPSLSASRIATSAHSGMSRPSRSRLMPMSDVEGAQPQIADDLDALEGVDVGVHVAHPHAELVQIFGQILGHPLGQHRDQRAVAGLRRRGTSPSRSSTWDRAGRISITGGSMRPVGRITCSANTPPLSFHLPAGGVAETCDRLRTHRVPFLEAQGAVVEAGGQAEAVLGERRLAAEVAPVHAADLRHGDVALVGEDERVVGHTRTGSAAARRAAAGEVARIVLDAVAASRRLDHLDVEGAALLQPLRFDEAAHPGQLVERAVFSSVLIDLDCLLQGRARCDIVRVRVDLDELRAR
jgi:hypothetical protein